MKASTRILCGAALVGMVTLAQAEVAVIIGYVDSSAVNGSVKVLFTLP